MKWPLNKSLTIFLMIPLVSAYSFSLDLYIPLLPAIQSALEVSRSDMQLTNSLFMLFCGAGQLFFGPLSDRLGRRSILLLSMSMSIHANLICMHATQYALFLFGKSLQAIGACGAYLTCFATIRDLYHQPEKSAEMFSYLNIANSVSAIIAPSIGTQLGNHFGWQSIFFTLSIYAVYGFISCYFFYAETAPEPQPQQKKRSVINDYCCVFTHVNFQVYTLPAALGISSFFAYYSISPYLYQQTFGLSRESFSILFGSCGLTFFIGSFVCSRLVNQFGVMKTLILGIAFHAIGCCGLILSFIFLNSLKLAIMHLSVMLIIWGSSLMVSSGIGGTMAPFKSIAGCAFALISAYKFTLCYCLGELAMHFYDNTPIPLGIMLLSINILAVIILLCFRHKVIGSHSPPSSTAAMSSEMSKSTDNIL